MLSGEVRGTFGNVGKVGRSLSDRRVWGVWEGLCWVGESRTREKV